MDRERPLTIERTDADSVTVGLPLLADVAATSTGATAYVGPCTVRAVILVGAARDSVLALDDGGLQALIAATQFASVGASSVQLDAGGVRSARVSFRAEVPEDPDPPQAAADDRSYLLEVWSNPSSDLANRCSGVPSPGAEPSSRYMIDFELARPLGGSIMGGGAYLIAAVGLTTLLALAFGGG